MSSSRLARLHLSQRYLALQRFPQLSFTQPLTRRTNSTSHPPTSTTTPAPTPQPTPASQPTKPLPRYRRAILYSLLALTLGFSAGSFVSHTIAPPPHPIPGSHEDAILVHDLENRIDEEFKVKVLRGKCLATGRKLRGEEAEWREIDAETVKRIVGTGSQAREEGLRQQADALGVEYHAPAGEERYERLTGKTMAGARALGAERVFWNAKDKELVAVVWLGGGLSGWPGVVHGGAIASVLSEKSGLAVRLDAESHGQGDKGGSEEGLPELKSIEFNYKKPTYANRFYVVRVVPHSVDGSATGVLGRMMSGEVDVDGSLESMDGVTCVEMKAVLPLKRLEAAESKIKEVIKQPSKWFT